MLRMTFTAADGTVLAQWRDWFPLHVWLVRNATDYAPEEAAMWIGSVKLTDDHLYRLSKAIDAQTLAPDIDWSFDAWSNGLFSEANHNKAAVSKIVAMLYWRQQPITYTAIEEEELDGAEFG